MLLKKLMPAPQRLCGAEGDAAAFGRYLGPIANTDTAQLDGSGMFSLRRAQRKGWLYFGAFSERFMVGYAVVDAGYLATAFVYVYDRQKKTLVEEKLARPFGFAAGFAPALHGRWSLEGGARRWLVEPEGSGWRAEFAGRQMRLTMHVDGDAPGMSVIAPSPGRTFHHTYKVCALDIRIELEIGGHNHQAAALGVVDFSLGYPPRRTFWNWASLAGTTADGKGFGLNLVAPFNNGLENALWLDGELHPLAQAHFRYENAHSNRPWQLSSEDGLFEIEFEPEGRRAESLNAGLVASNFSQPFGKFRGVLELPGGQTPIEGWGVTEEHWALW